MESSFEVLTISYAFGLICVVPERCCRSWKFDQNLFQDFLKNHRGKAVSFQTHFELLEYMRKVMPPL
jgi:hypothetical protein